MQRAKRPVMATVLATSMMLAGMAPVTAAGAEDDLTFKNDRPSELAMLADILVARPMLAASTGVGFVAFTATLPFSILGGNEHEAARTLVAKPAYSTFLRCLGCNPRQDERLKREQRTARVNKPEDNDE